MKRILCLMTILVLAFLTCSLTYAASDSKGRYVESETLYTNQVICSSNTPTALRTTNLDCKHGWYSNYTAYDVFVGSHTGITVSTGYKIAASSGTLPTNGYSGPLYGLSQAGDGGLGKINIFEER